MRNNLCPSIPNKKKKILNSKKNQQQQIDEEEMDEVGIMDNDEAPSAKQDSRYRLETDKKFAERREAALNKETPDGIVKRGHWIALYNLKTNRHLKLKHTQSIRPFQNSRSCLLRRKDT
ncbi:DNA-directed RNA polymerase subunit beta'' [Frankliniella fusca]|uniref:DNA-directed RNA polymerase subunit beta n=1 Tax=Frankliniella fusca TaxID=407009 RepID=A0AAE1LQ40_9NEOP|nr:DNA-directed RNA polymerase subunit beta'' [Frankliniella fusca]